MTDTNDARHAEMVRIQQEAEIDRMRLELLELADALEVMRKRWPAASSKRWADRLIKRTRDRYYGPWLDSVAGVLLNDGGVCA